MKTPLLPLAVLLCLTACGQGSVNSTSLPAVDVTAAVETDPVGTSKADAADDPAIWRNASDPGASLVVGTDKKAGLYVYGLDGRARSYLAAGLLNNVDLIGGAESALVVASDRSEPENSRLALFTLERDGKLTALGSASSGPGEAYGICLQRRGASLDKVVAYAAIKDGTVREVTLTRGQDGTYAGAIGRHWKIATQIEGCVTNPVNGDLYVGEEDVGIWRIRMASADPVLERFASVGAAQGLVADVEGLAFVTSPSGRPILIASSQGDNAYAVLDGESGTLIGRVRITDGDTIDGTSETDGIELMTGDFGPVFPMGLFVAQDGANAGGAQNFKLVSWASVLEALQIE